MRLKTSSSSKNSFNKERSLNIHRYVIAGELMNSWFIFHVSGFLTEQRINVNTVFLPGKIIGIQRWSSI